ncbi:hypothetical protein [Ornithinibacillus californiensis]|nr:hypothetical protein [Ornithinibacillus californiensis]
MRKFLLMLLLIFPAFSLAACGDEELPDDGEDIEEIEEEDEIGDGEIDDE